MRQMGKRGISDIIVSMIMIVIVLGAITIVWFLIRGFIGTGTEQINTGTQCLEVDVKPISLTCSGTNNATCEVTVSRGTGGNDIGGIKLVFTNSTGTKNYVYDASGNINVLETNSMLMPAFCDRFDGESTFFNVEVGTKHGQECHLA